MQWEGQCLELKLRANQHFVLLWRYALYRRFPRRLLCALPSCMARQQLRQASPFGGTPHPAGAALLARQLLHNALAGLHTSPSLSTAPCPAETARQTPRLVMWWWPYLKAVGPRLALAAAAACLRQWPKVYDLCHTFLHVARVRKHTDMRELHVFHVVFHSFFPNEV